MKYEIRVNFGGDDDGQDDPRVVEGSLANKADSNAPDHVPTGISDKELHDQENGLVNVGCGMLAMEGFLGTLATTAFVFGNRLGEAHPRLAVIANVVGGVATAFFVGLGVVGSRYLVETERAIEAEQVSK